MRLGIGNQFGIGSAGCSLGTGCCEDGGRVTVPCVMDALSGACAAGGGCMQHVCMSEQPQGRDAGSQRGQNDSTFTDLLANHLNNSSHIEKYIYIYQYCPPTPSSLSLLSMFLRAANQAEMAITKQI